jgi:hypothetical protein
LGRIDVSTVTESLVALYLGAILGGPEQIGKPFRQEMDAIGLREEALQPDLIKPTDGLLNVVFHFTGSLFRPDFTGIKVGRFIKRDNRLEIKVAIPPDTIQSADFAIQYVALVKEAIAKGKRVFDKKGIPFSVEDHVNLVDKSLEALRERK